MIQTAQGLETTSIPSKSIITKHPKSGGYNYIVDCCFSYFLCVFQSKRVFLIRGGYRRIRKCLRKRGWIELDYYRTSIKSTKEGGTSSPKKSIEIVRPSRCGGYEDSGDDDSDGDADGNDGGAVSEEEYSDEEEYCMMVSKAVQKLGKLW